MQAQQSSGVPLSLQPHSTLQKILQFKVGIVPLFMYVPMLILTYILMLGGTLPKDMLGAILIMVMFGFVLAEIGNRIPYFKNIGGSSILATFFPSYMVAHHLLPQIATDTVTTFMKSTNFLYVYISILVVGSILGMNRQILIKAFLRMLVPLLAGTLVAMGVGVGVGSLLGLGVYKSFFYVVVPIMAGGVGEGAVPLSISYAAILKSTQDAQLPTVLPAVMLGSLSAIILAGLLKKLGERKPEWSGNGVLVKSGNDKELLEAAAGEKRSISLPHMAAGAAMAIAMYLFGGWINKMTGLPAPIVMLFLAVLIKLTGKLPKDYEDGAFMSYRFFVTAVTFPLLMGVGVAMTPWSSLIAVLNPAYLITIFCTVLAMITTGFFVGKWMKMFPIESAIVTACHSGQGGTGDVAILTASDRLMLMPFAQVSTRIFGAITVTTAVALLSYFH
ncbi:2-hydroxycarboxylate transporter family protein [Tumebacillus flagellatus]|uniref:Malate permease n=1 Tax=Tumebacillus flagellatus TaxID=1157490 RepID=A0A074LQ70_9BACL|nr:2-hydroxycarboxylate transporter family protein [Tumebacillus flagellatus]KEO83244.1 malate permease [Tumebacillus flagellatus]